MELAPLSKLRSHVLKELLAEERDEWLRVLNWDYTEPQRILSTMVDMVALPGFVALENQKPIGYTFYVEETGRGLIGTCFVRREFEGKGVDEQLLNSVVSRLQTSGAIQRIESQFINFRNWEIDHFFKDRQFRRFERCFMVRKCQIDSRTPSPVEVELKPWSWQDLSSAAHLTADSYQNLIDREVTYHYHSVRDCQNFLSNIIFRPGCGTFLPEASYSAWDRQSNELTGFVLTSRISSQDGHIPQIVVSSKYQGRGVGSCLLRRALRYLAINGYETVSLTVTEKNTAAVSLYTRFAFSVHFRFPAFVWQR